MTKEELKDKAHSLPLHPGVYIMMDASNTVIYVGKAKALQQPGQPVFSGAGQPHGKDPGHGQPDRPF